MPREKQKTQKQVKPPKLSVQRSSTQPNRQAPQVQEEISDMADSSLEINRSTSANRKASTGKQATSEDLKKRFKETMRERVTRRMRPGSKALKQIKQFQMAPTLLVRRLPFQNFVRDIAYKEAKKIAQDNAQFSSFQPRFSQPALLFLQTLTEDYMTGLFEDSLMCTLHARRVTLQSKDLQLAKRIRGNNDPGYQFHQ